MKRRHLAWLLGPRMPRTSGVLRVDGPGDEVVVRRDRHGIPHIDASDEADAAFGVGFCQGQDRTFQLEMLRRVGRGTVAALVGRRGLPIDRLSRRIGFRRSAEAQVAAQTESTLTQLAAFAAGVNAAARAGLRRRPHEFALLRADPAAWDTADVLGTIKLVGFMLSTNWSTKVARLRILLDDGPGALVALEPGYEEAHPLISPPGREAGPALDRLADEIAALEAVVGSGLSNNWVIGGERTASGAPVVANDPHLNPSIPSQWYLAHVRTPRWEVAGATFAGAPSVIAGHNGHAAWGVTNGAADLCDLWLERLGPEPGTVLRGDSFVPCEVREEHIEVRRGAPVVEVVHVTDRGPIIGPALDGGVDAIAFDAAWLSTGRVAGFVEAHTRHGFDDFRHTFEHWPSASLNVVYGDASGGIGWQFAGEIPRRPGGGSLLPIPAAEGTGGHGTVPFASMPFEACGPDGMLVTANNKPVASSAAPYLGSDWTMGYRAIRIREVLATRDDWDVEATLELQTDQASVPWRDLRGIFTGIDTAGDPDVGLAVELLSTWDGVVSAASAAAAVFEVFLDRMTVAIVRAKAPRSWEWALGRGPHAITPFNTFHTTRLPQIVSLLRERPADWFEQSGESAGDGWDGAVRHALADAVSLLRGRFGDDTGTWAWGELRPLRLPHLLGGDSSPLARIFDIGPFAWGGDLTSVNMCSSNPNDITANPVLVPTFRMVVPVGKWDDARFVLAGGQSGNPASPHYDDMVEPWKGGAGVPIAWSPEAVSAATVTVLHLLPAGAAEGS
ncbi:MAG: penicillin acylase family protein [Acidimicrobiia bacterium]|nr:penicillin acylase family protein [Acidimicrobiia bacterium]